MKLPKIHVTEVWGGGEDGNATVLNTSRDGNQSRRITFKTDCGKILVLRKIVFISRFPERVK